MLDAGYASSSLLAGGGASERGCLPMGGRTGRGGFLSGVVSMARFRPDAFPGGNPWQFFHPMHPKKGLGREKRPFVATYRRRVSKTSWLWQDMLSMYSKCPANRLSGMHRAKILPGRGPFAALTPRIMHTAQILPSVAAEQRERSRARRRLYGAAACLGTAEPGAGGFLSGGVAPPKEFVALWGHRALTEKPASAKRRLRVSDADRLAESREPAFAGRVQGGVAARRHRSSRPAERGLLAARALGASSFPLDEKVSPLVLLR